VRARVRLVEDLTFVAETASGHGLVIDTSRDQGGRGLGPSPMELVLAGAAACTAFDIAIILRKMRQPIEGLEVIAEAKRRDEPPRTFTDIHLEYIVKGPVDERRVEQAVKLSIDTWCSAINNLVRGGTSVTYTFRVEGKTQERE